MPALVHDKTGTVVAVGDQILTPAHDHSTGEVMITTGIVERILDFASGRVEVSHSSGLVREEIYTGCVSSINN